MIYKEFQDISLPMLSVGAMRLPVIGEDSANIDEKQTEEMFDYAMAHGVNYFDTAWGYHNGKSESVVGKLLSKYPRDSFFLATKFPGYDLSNMDKVEEIFEEQLKRCLVDYFDFYLFHNVCEANIDAYLDRSHGIYDYLMEQKSKGRIKHLGFSLHGSYDVLARFLEAYGEGIEFAQLQINWIDWEFQKVQEKVELLERYNIPVWVMEPLRGGTLVNLSEDDKATLKALRPDEGIAAWSFRYLQTIPGMTTILGGMSTLDQMKENIATFEEEKPLSVAEMAVLNGIADAMVNRVSVPCTACRYCIEYCPQELDIPTLIEFYNQRKFTGDNDFIASMGLSALPEDKKPSACIACGACEDVCPQQLAIADTMEEFATLMN